MSRRHDLVYALNAGGVDPEAISRVDLEKMRLAGEHPVANWLPRVLGPMTLRPGLESLYRIPGDAVTRQVPFHRSFSASYTLLLTPSEMRIDQDGVIAQVPAVSTAIDSGAWSDESTSPATATGGATLTFEGTAAVSAKLRQAVTVASADQTVPNILRIVVDPGNIVLRVGTTAGGQDLIPDTTLRTGTHKISITPNAATIYIELRSDADVTRTVTQIQFESTLIGGTGDLVLPTPWGTSAALDALRWWRSKDVLYVGDGLVQQRQIERRGDLSWSVVKHQGRKGPYTGGNSKITMTVGALLGNTTVTASEAYFQPGHEGALIEVTATDGKLVNGTFTAAAQSSDYVTITGVGSSRKFGIATASSGGFTGTLVLQRSFDSGVPLIWQTYRTYTDATAVFSREEITDGQDNLTVHYRFYVDAWTSGTLDYALEYTDGTAIGHARITGYTSPTVVDVEVLQAFGTLTASNSWRIGAWSDVLGWPRTPAIVDDRMCWFRDDEIFGSVVEDYTLHDDNTVGDSGPFIRTVGDEVFWVAIVNRLLIGTPSFEGSIQASEIDTPITPTSFTVRRPSRRRSADIACAEHDDGVFFAQQSTRRIYELYASGDTKPSSQDMTRLIPSGCRAGIVRMAVQQQPDTRLYTVLADGTVLILTFDRDDKVAAFTTLTTDGGLIEDACVLPTIYQDDVSFIVNRDGVRYRERLAREADQIDKDTCALHDAHKVLTGSITSITGGTHLAGQSVAVWADGIRHADVTLDGAGAAPLTGGPYARVVYGKAYTAAWKSVKLAYAAQLGTALGQTKRVHGAGLILSNSCLDGITIGGATDQLMPMDAYYEGALLTPNQFITHYDQDVFPIQSDWGPDARLLIRANSAEGPVTIAAVVLDIETREGIGAARGNG